MSNLLTRSLRHLYHVWFKVLKVSAGQSDSLKLDICVQVDWATFRESRFSGLENDLCCDSPTLRGKSSWLQVTGRIEGQTSDRQCLCAHCGVFPNYLTHEEAAPSGSP